MSANHFCSRVKEIEWTRPSVIALLVANLAPLFGVLVLHWEVYPLLLLFWFESLIIGAGNALKMAAASPPRPLAWAGKYFYIPFFCLHYGGFAFVHGSILLALFGPAPHHGGPRSGEPMLWRIEDSVEHYHLGWAILVLAVSHAVSLVTNYFVNGEYRRATLPALMTQPYDRVVVLHLTILFVGFLVLALNSPLVGVVLLVVLKTALDLLAHQRERTKFAPRPLPSMNLGGNPPADSP